MTYVVPPSILRARRLDWIGGGFLMLELSPISVSSVMRNPVNDISNVAEELFDTKPTPGFFSRGCFDPFSLNHVLPQR